MKKPFWKKWRFWKYVLIYLCVIACICCFDRVFLRSIKYLFNYEPYRLVLNSPMKLLLLSDGIRSYEVVDILGEPQSVSNTYSGFHGVEWYLSGGLVLEARHGDYCDNFRITGFHWQGLIFPILKLLMICALVIAYHKRKDRASSLTRKEKAVRLRNIAIVCLAVLLLLVLFDQVVLCRMLKNEDGCAPYRVFLPLGNTAQLLGEYLSKEKVLDILGPPSYIRTTNGTTRYCWNLLFGPVIEFTFNKDLEMSNSNILIEEYSLYGWILPSVLLIMGIASAVYYGAPRKTKRLAGKSKEDQTEN